MINAIAVDDEPGALRIIENFAAQTPGLKLQKTFTQPREALYYMSCFPVDLIFLDIQMPTVSGIEFLNKAQQKTMVIFTTAYSEYAVAGFNLNAVDFLLKPFTLERFMKAVEKAESIFTAQQQSAFQNPDCFFVRANYSLVKIDYNDILYIEGLDDYVKIHLASQQPVLARMTIKNILDKLPQQNFVRVHRSFIIPIRRIEQLRKNMILVAGTEIPVGVSYKDVIDKLAGLSL